MSTFEVFIADEARAALRNLAATREAVKRRDATPEEGEAFLDAANAADAVRAVMEESGYAALYRAIREEIDAENA